MLGLIRREFDDYLQFFVRWLPGRSGSLLRYYYFRNHTRFMGANVNISPGCTIRTPENINIFDNVSLGLGNQLYAGVKGGPELIALGSNTATNSNVMFNADIGGKITVGHDVLIGPNVIFRTSTHNFSQKDMPIRMQGHTPGIIIVEDNVWVGANSFVLHNVRVGSGAVVAAGSIVTKSVERDTVVGGVPAKLIKKR